MAHYFLLQCSWTRSSAGRRGAVQDVVVMTKDGESGEATVEEEGEPLSLPPPPPPPRRRPRADVEFFTNDVTV